MKRKLYKKTLIFMQPKILANRVKSTMSLSRVFHGPR